MGIVLNEAHTDVARSLDGRALYTCDAPKCEVRRVPWSSGWVWYGSYREMDDDPRNIPTFCSDKCAKIAQEMMRPKPFRVKNQ